MLTLAHTDCPVECFEVTQWRELVGLQFGFSQLRDQALDDLNFAMLCRSYTLPLLDRITTGGAKICKLSIK